MDEMKMVKRVIEEANRNKKQWQCKQSGWSHQIIKLDQPLPADIINAEYKEEEDMILLDFTIFTSPWSSTKRIARFKMDGMGAVFYDRICEILGTDGNPADLIGKYAVIHIERKGDFENLKVDYEMDEQEFLEMVNSLGSKSTKKKSVHKKRTSKRTADEKKSARKVRKNTVENNEMEDLEPDVDYEDEYDDRDYADECDGDYEDEYDDRNAEQEYLDDMADFQG